MVGKNPHCLTCALIDFAVLAVQTAWRGVEWVQPKNPRIKGKVKLEFYEYDNATSKFDNTTCGTRKIGRASSQPKTHFAITFIYPFRVLSRTRIPSNVAPHVNS